LNTSALDTLFSTSDPYTIGFEILNKNSIKFTGFSTSCNNLQIGFTPPLSNRIANQQEINIPLTFSRKHVLVWGKMDEETKKQFSAKITIH
jgi:hypothetical protein